jgi:prepilin-type N-terminal cleavage/methylation domain-containing protein
MKINKRIKNQKRAFSMIELIMVLVVLGIVSSIGASVIAQVYKQYILQRATHDASIKIELAALQLENMLSDRVPKTVLAKDPANLTDSLYLTEEDTTNTHTVLEWIGADYDGFSSKLIPGWSGFCDVEASSQLGLKVLGSDLAFEDNVIKNLSNNQAQLDGLGNNPAIFFRDNKYAYAQGTLPERMYDVKNCMGLIDSNRSCISTVYFNPSSPKMFNFDSTAASVSNKLIAEHFKLAWTAYAIVPIKHGTINTTPVPCKANEICDLALYYNYQPWNGTNLVNTNLSSIPHSLLVENISTFRFAESANTIRFKICATENIGEDKNITICKEKAVTR